jgi:putative spermidine/putrescine transport system ATP-binding protein
MSNAFLQIRGLRQTYGHVVAIDRVSLDIMKGEFMTFLGPSGSGKSTTLYIVAGFQEPTEGEVFLNGKELLNTPPNLRNIGMVFQRYTLFPHLTIAENVAFPLRVRRWPEHKIKAKVSEMLELVHLADIGNRLPAQLSGGQQQRVAIARALAYDPPVLLMDEPLSALDKKLREELQFELRRIHQETGVTILYVTHDQEEALRLSDRIAVFNQGRIEQVGTGEELYEAPASRFVANFVGNSNFLPVKVTKVNGAKASGVFPDGYAVEGALSSNTLASGTNGSLMLRPEQIRIKPATSMREGASLPVMIRDMTYLGDSMHFAVETSWKQEISIRMPLASRGGHDFSIGAPALIEWDTQYGRVFA